MRTIRDVMNMDVRDLEFSVRCSNCMARMNIKKLSELTAMSKDDISKMRNIGKNQLTKLMESLPKLDSGGR